jgi:hypothetical protein
MKRLILIPLLAVAPLHAQDFPPVDLAARRESVVNLRQHIQMREERLKEIITDIRALDERTEKRIDSLVDTLKNLKDSESSKTRVNALKEEAIAGLRKGISVYQEKRRAISENLRTDKSAPAEALTGDMEKFDARIQKRVDQIVELAKSMPARQDVEKYESDGGGYWDGFGRYRENSRISEEWKQNRRQGVATETGIREIREALQKAISSLEDRKRTAEQALKNPSLSAADRTLQQDELDRINGLLDSRREELRNLALPNIPDGAATTVTKDQAEEMKDLLEDARKDIATDFWTVIRKYGQATDERDKITALKENLAAREKWLAEHDKPAK